MSANTSAARWFACRSDSVANAPHCHGHDHGCGCMQLFTCIATIQLQPEGEGGSRGGGGRAPATFHFVEQTAIHRPPVLLRWLERSASPTLCAETASPAPLSVCVMGGFQMSSDVKGSALVI